MPLRRSVAGRRLVAYSRIRMQPIRTARPRDGLSVYLKHSVCFVCGSRCVSCVYLLHFPSLVAGKAKKLAWRRRVALLRANRKLFPFTSVNLLVTRH